MTINFAAFLRRKWLLAAKFEDLMRISKIIILTLKEVFQSNYFSVANFSNSSSRHFKKIDKMLIQNFMKDLRWVIMPNIIIGENCFWLVQTNSRRIKQDKWESHNWLIWIAVIAGLLTIMHRHIYNFKKCVLHKKNCVLLYMKTDGKHISLNRLMEFSYSISRYQYIDIDAMFLHDLYLNQE